MRLKVGLLGFGRTGAVVAKEFASDKEISLEWVCKRVVTDDQQYASRLFGFSEDFAPLYSIQNFNKIFPQLANVDLIVDFSSGANSKIYQRFAEAGVKIVSAISNYSSEELRAVKDASSNTAVLYSPNITLGINWLIVASKMLKKIIPNADVEVIEEHFRDKKDVSGTALKLAQHLELDPKSHINSIRVGGIVGKHEVVFGLPNQTIRLTHESINRSAFGTGAIFAAKWLRLRSSGLYSMEDALKEVFAIGNSTPQPL